MTAHDGLGSVRADRRKAEVERTDAARSTPAVDVEVTVEPAFGAVVMVHGMTGTAAQRFFSDGLWHTTTGKTWTWDEVLDASQPQAPILLAHGEEFGA